MYAAALHRAGCGGAAPDFVLRGEGKTRVNTVPAYDVLYTATVEGREMYGRDVLLLPERAGAREGVEIVMLTAPRREPAGRRADGSRRPRACC